MRSRVVLILCCLAAIQWSAAPAASALEVNEFGDIQVGSFAVVELRDPSNGTWVIRVSWTANPVVDVWLLDAANFTRYQASATFRWYEAQQGSSGAINFTVNESKMAAEPFYLVFDNTAQGPTPDRGIAANYHAWGTVDSTTPTPLINQARHYPDDWTASPWLVAEVVGPFVAAIVVPLFLVALFIARGHWKAKREGAIERDLKAGRLVGEASREEAAAGMPAAKGCRSCGAPVRADLAFCPRCGARAP